MVEKPDADAMLDVAVFDPVADVSPVVEAAGADVVALAWVAAAASDDERSGAAALQYCVTWFWTGGRSSEPTQLL